MNLLRILDPVNLIKVHRRIQFGVGAATGKGVRVSHRADLYHHGPRREQVRIGDHVIIDGTIEVYERGQVNIGAFSFIGRARIYCAHRIDIGCYCLLSDNVTVMDSDLHPVAASKRRSIAEKWASGSFPDVYSDVEGKPVKLNDHCWVGFGAAIMKGTTLGEGAIVGAGAVVTRDVAPWTIVAGNPARPIKEIPPHER